MKLSLSLVACQAALLGVLNTLFKSLNLPLLMIERVDFVGEGENEQWHKDHQQPHRGYRDESQHLSRQSLFADVRGKGGGRLSG